MNLSYVQSPKPQWMNKGLRKEKKVALWLVLLVVVISSVGIATQLNKKPNLVELSDRASYLSTTKLIAEKAKEPLEHLIADAEKDGMCLVVIGAYRSPEEQQKLYEDASRDGLVAKPGTSEHQTGLAVDFSGCPTKDGVRDDSAERPELAGPFEELPEYKWLQMNAGTYGFTQSYRLDNQEKTGFPAEPWHWKYR